MRYHELKEATVPYPDSAHIRDAIDHVDHYQEGWIEDDFKFIYGGLLAPDDIAQYDDFSSWVEAETPNDLERFRGGSFAKSSRNARMPPIIVITAPDEGSCHTQIGDGRGRVNWAVVHGRKLHVWHMVHKDCVEQFESEGGR